MAAESEIEDLFIQIIKWTILAIYHSLRILLNITVTVLTILIIIIIGMVLAFISVILEEK